MNGSPDVEFPAMLAKLLLLVAGERARGLNGHEDWNFGAFSRTRTCDLPTKIGCSIHLSYEGMAPRWTPKSSAALASTGGE